MKDTIKNFINLLIKGDFFLVFLIVMIVVIILVILYLVRLEVKNSKDEDDNEEDEKLLKGIDFYEKKDNKEVIKEEIPIPIKEETKDEDTICIDNSILEEISSLLENDEPNKEESIDIEETKEEPKEETIVKEETVDEEKAPITIKEVKEKAPIKQMNMFEYENEQEEKAIISAEELAKRLNDMKSANVDFTEDEIEKYENEQEEKAIISYDELLKRATEGIVNYEEKEDLGGLTISKVDFDKGKEITFDYKEEETITNPYQKEEAFLSSLKAFRRSL